MENTGLTQNQIKILTLICPAPFGRGLTHNQAAKELNKSVILIEKAIKNLHKNCPEAFKFLKEQRRKAAQTRLTLNKTRQLGGNFNFENLSIKEVF